MRARLWHRFAGIDGVGRHAAPLGEFFHPLPLLALVVLGLNDHAFKGSGLLPGWLTGKLSDFAGLLFFPLLLTAGADSLAWLLARRHVDFSLRPWKLAAAILATGIAFSLLKLSPGAARALDGILGGWTIADRTDLVALSSLAVAWWVGSREIARVPLGRLEVIERRGARTPAAIEADLRDVAARRGGSAVRRLADGLSAWLGGDDTARTAADEALDDLRR
jgi:hypothetical protein